MPPRGFSPESAALLLQSKNAAMGMTNPTQPNPNQSVSGFTCPDCGGTKFIEGPHGGLSVNFMCANQFCRARFNDGACRVSRHGKVSVEDLVFFNPLREYTPWCNKLEDEV